MTICIAALYNNGKGCVLASDQMITAHIPIGFQFENDEVDKIVGMSSNSPIHALIAGDVLFANEVLDTARKEAESQGITTAPGIAELIRKAYQSTRLTSIIRTQLEPRGLDLQAYYGNHRGLLAQLVQLIDQAFADTDVGVDLMIAGPSETRCSIYTIANPGQLACHDAIGYGAIGTGAPHAMYSLIESNYKKSLGKEAVEKLVRKAKLRSEVAPGVGKKTTVIVTPTEGG